MEDTIRSGYNDDSGLWQIEVLVNGSWFRVAEECSPSQTECIVKLLKAWRDEK